VSHIWSDGFTAYSFLSDLDNLYTREGLDNNLRFNQTGGQSEQGSVRLGGVDQSEAGFYRDLGTSITIGYIGFWFRFNDFDTADGLDDMIMKLSATTTARMSLRLSDDGSLQIRRSTNGTEHFDSSDVNETADGQQHFLFRGTEYKIELKIEGVNTVGSLELRVNDEVWGILDNKDFDGTYNRIYFKTGEVGEGADYEISDLYIMDDQGTIKENKGFLGSTWKIELIRPDAESATIGFTPESGVDNSAMVDDTPRNNQDADWNDSTADAQVDRFTSTGVLDGTLVHNVSLMNVARHTGTAQNFRGVIFEGATVGNGTDEALTANFEVFMEDFETNPDTSALWTDTEVEAAEFGYESRA
jgi:hypothetical protein